MSKYEDYDSVSCNYDDQRQSMGSDAMVAMIQFYGEKPLKDVHVLDAGCGTGNYAKDFIKHGVGHVTLLDASMGMLEKAKSKLSDQVASGKVTDVVQTKLPTMSFADSTFDVVMFNLVLHHLETQAENRNFENTTEALKEARRVLKPEGVILISTLLPHAFTKSIWFSQINPSITERIVKRLPCPERWEQIFEAADIKCLQKINFLGDSLLNDYYNFEGPLDDEWLRGCSCWTLGTPEELKEVKTFVKELKEKGELENWGRSHDHVHSSGMLTVYVLKMK